MDKKQRSSNGNLPIPKSSCSAEDGSGLWHWNEREDETGEKQHHYGQSVKIEIRKELHVLFSVSESEKIYLPYSVFCFLFTVKMK